VNNYRAFRDLLEQKGLTYSFNTDTEMYEIYRGRPWEIVKDLDFVVSVSAQMARRDIAESHALICTALELEVLFGS
jgi:glucosamine 6-phosphate synthetase-like amidotransferase/phosphosugar isomerase protein